jgi:preprotein translocase subunit SecD
VSESELYLSIAIMNERLQKLHVKNTDLARDGKRIVFIAPSDAIERSLPVLIRPGRLEFFDLQGDLTGPSLDAQRFPHAEPKPLSPRPHTVVVTCGPKARYCPGLPEKPRRPYYYLFKYDPDNTEHPIPELTGADLNLKGTRNDIDPVAAEPVVLMSFTDSGAKKFQTITQTLAERGRTLHNERGGDPQNYFQQFAIVLDREMRSAPTIDFNQNPAGIPGDNGAQITGIGSLNEAKDLALVLQTGALPFAFRVVSREERHK